MSKPELITIIQNLHDWFVTNDYKGIDPFQLDEKAFGVIKRYPALKHVRGFLKPLHGFIPKKVFSGLKPIYHPKALGLIISANSLLTEVIGSKKLLTENNKIVSLLENIRSKDFSNYAWGHPFEWGQNPRYPKDTALVCVTTPIGLWLLDYLEVSKDEKVLEICKSITKNLLEDNEYAKPGNDSTAIYYSNLDKQYTYNGSALVAAYLYRFDKFEKTDLDLARKLINFVISEQNPDGSWYYSQKAKSEKDTSTIDNRHTGYILESLSIIYKISGDSKVKEALDKGVVYYLKNLFEDGLPKWSPSQNFPIDIHDVAQAIITLTEIGEFEKAERIINFTIKNMFDGKSEFYYKYFKNNQTNKSVFVRWGQAWMYQAISKYLLNCHPRT